jgi:hypothetical protein
MCRETLAQNVYPLETMTTSPKQSTDTAGEAGELRCLECGTPLFYRGTGRYPRYCGSSCRHRGWERNRAAKEGIVATQVAPNPASRSPRITHAAVVDWLVGHPRRLAKVLTDLPADTVTAETLAKTAQRMRTEGAETDQGTDSSVVQREFAEYRQRVIHRDREQTERLTALERDNAALHAQLTRACRRTEPLMDHRSQPTGAAAPPDGHKSVEMGGKTFHVPEEWSRQQIRKWCRANPDKSVS